MSLSDMQGCGEPKAESRGIEARLNVAQISTQVQKETKVNFGKMLLDEIEEDLAVENGLLRTKKLQAMVTPRFYIRVKIAAAKKGLSVSDFLRKILEKVVPEED